MRKYIIIISLLIVSCKEPVNNKETVKKSTEIFIHSSTITTVEHEGCEYVILYLNSGGSIIHKHNCKYCNKK
jgi:hypothetical protein